MKQKDKKKLFLHIGTRKTATSSIQKTIYRNRKIFEKNNLYYPKNWREAHNLEIYCMFADKPENYSFNVFNNYSKQQVEENNEINRKNIISEIKNTKCKNILLSAEDASALTQKNIENLKKFINHELNITNTKIIVAVRDILSYIASDMQQLIKDGVGEVNIKLYENFYRNKIEKYINVFGRENIIVYKFEDSVEHEMGPVGYFCDILEVHKDVLSKITIEKTNEGVSDKAIDLIKYINSKVPLTNNLKLSDGRFKGDTQLLNFLSGNKFIPKKEYQERVLKQNSNDLKWLKSILNIDYTKTKVKEPYKIKYDGVFADEILDIYSSLSPLIRRLTYEYILKQLSRNTDKSDILNLQKILNHILENDIENLLDSNIVTNAKSKKPTNIIDLQKDLFENVDNLRGLAFILEKSGEIKMAYYFINEALKIRPNGPILKKKVEEYKNLLFK
ncbi:hypothetical protein FJR45_01330 [Sulfurimonas sediminis]|uniref:Sulfotransferase domain-containing protein n=1 Tax=Sulfurimonas sediminis TaxID=2590020 RepID=A0A7M1AYY6_9BACT|nr:hypothetical protein [Sulfurimonas sediminis]QOP42663.1 hypothetical protein FJR45_01330 [Sulfurimonas sediminis]